MSAAIINFSLFLLVLLAISLFVLKGKSRIIEFVKLSRRSSINYFQNKDKAKSKELSLRVTVKSIYTVLYASIFCRLATIAIVLSGCKSLINDFLLNEVIKSINLLAFSLILYIPVRVWFKQQFQNYHLAALIHFILFATFILISILS
jgi:hypothetical protein